jgi:transposase
MKYTAGIDLHSNNLFLAVLDDNGQCALDRKLPCSLSRVLHELHPYQENLKSVAVESTFNWYWLIDGLVDHGLPAILANPAKMGQYNGIKYTDDKHDARLLAEQLRLDILPTGYIYDKQTRPVRDLLRRRLGMVRKQTSTLLSLKSLYQRNTGEVLSTRQLKKMDAEEAWKWFPEENDQLVARLQLQLLEELKGAIAALESQALKKMPMKSDFRRLTQISGIGKVLGLTIALETGDISRFPKAGHYASYCRCVDSRRLSNGKQKGRNNGKNGNKYLSWAYVEAANFCRRHDERARSYFDRKAAKTNQIVATKTLSCKLCKAAWHMMTNETDFDPARAFG